MGMWRNQISSQLLSSRLKAVLYFIVLYFINENVAKTSVALFGYRSAENGPPRCAPFAKTRPLYREPLTLSLTAIPNFLPRDMLLFDRAKYKDFYMYLRARPGG
jgi:hypothetical protein